MNPASTADTWRRIEELFEAAVGLPLEERAGFLKSRCGDEVQLLNEVQRLLRGHERAGEDFLRPPPADPRLAELLRGDDAPDPLIGRSIAAYTVKQVIARGGMGTVYLAEQQRPRREVALKVLHAGLWSRSAERRFEFESQVLARLRHPNIAVVYEAGVHRLGDEPARSLPFFAMEYVPNAKPITKYANDAGLGIRERLALFLQVCDAVHHGHTKGVIHRDLKPGNILVAGEQRRDLNRAATVRERSAHDREGPQSDRSPLPYGRGSDGFVKVIDFGVAKSTDSDVAATTMQTDAGQIIGTLQYMSPEQCEADPHNLDTRTDVYSLAVVLYELLTERLPYDVSNLTIHSAARKICEQEPTKPSEFNRRLRGDLETVVLEALEKQREKRYSSVAELAADIRRYLVGEPISARPTTRWNRAVRWVGRRPLAATTAACATVAVLTLASTVASVWWLRLRPYDIKVDPDLRCARLVSVTGETLHTWPADPKPGEQRVCAAKLVVRAEKFGGGKLVIVGYSENHLNNEQRGLLCAYEVEGDLDKPVWSKGVDDDDVPEDQQNRGRRGSDCHVGCLMTADVFNEISGEEIIAIYTLGAFSQRAIRIYDADGNLLYQVWQDGSVYPGHWDADHGLLVLGGLSEKVKETAQRTVDAVKPIGLIVFAIRPERDVITNEYIENLSDANRRLLAWCKYVHPLSTADFRLNVHVSSPETPDRGAVAQVRIDMPVSPVCAVNLGIDNNGIEVPETRYVDDRYAQLRADGLLPPEDIFQLRGEPPTEVWTPADKQGGPASASQPVLQARVHASIVSDDDGGRAARVTPEQVVKWVEFANRAFATAGIEFLFDPRNDCTPLRSTLVNNMAEASDPNWQKAKARANEIAARYPDKLVVFFRHGPGDKGTGGGFSWTDLNFVVMPGWEDASHCGHPHVDALAHETGHYLGLPHLFAKPFDTVEQAAKFLEENGNDPKCFDGDGLNDTPPDPCVRFTECERLEKLALNGRIFELPRRNLMSYYDERDSLSPQQIEHARWFLRKRIANGMAMPTNSGAKHPIEAEALAIAEAKECETIVQKMAGLGCGTWSGGAQLFCKASKDGSVTLLVPVERTGRYRLDLYATLAPDYGRVRVQLDGRKIGKTIDGYAPGVYESGCISLGVVRLDAGPHRLTFRAVGKSAASRGHCFGIDCVDVMPE